MRVKNRTQWNITKIGRRSTISNDTIGKHGEWVWVIAEKHARTLHSNAASPVRMINKNEFTPVGVSLIHRGKLTHLWAKRSVLSRCHLCE